MKKYKTALIGCGRIASLYEADKKAKKYYRYLTHGSTLTAHPRIDLVAAVDINANLVERFVKKWNVEKAYVDYRQMVNEIEPEILVICTPVETHEEIVGYASDKVKFIFCEKPLAIDLKSVERIKKMCQDNKMNLAVNLYRNFDKSHNRIIQFIREGNIGAIQTVSCIYGKGLSNIGSHALSWLISCLGKPRWVFSLEEKKFPPFPESSYNFYLKFQNNVACNFQAVDFNNFRLFEFDIIGEKGRIKITDEGLTFSFYKKFSNRAESEAYELREVKPYFSSSIGDSFYHAFDNIINFLDGTEKLTSSIDDYIVIQQTIDAVKESFKLEKKIKISEELNV